MDVPDGKRQGLRQKSRKTNATILKNKMRQKVAAFRTSLTLAAYLFYVADTAATNVTYIPRIKEWLTSSHFLTPTKFSGRKPAADAYLYSNKTEQLTSNCLTRRQISAADKLLQNITYIPV